LAPDRSTFIVTGLSPDQDKILFSRHAFQPDGTQMKSTDRFSGLANIYAASRPTYPAEAIDFIMEKCKISTSTTMVDVGCGTGISTRLFSARGVKVIGIEPNDDMRLSAQSETETSRSRTDEETSNYVRPEYLAGTAEDTGLADQFADVVLSAQAFHWFDPDKALAEFHRIIKPNGYVVLMWNERDESDRFSRGYGDLFRQLPETAKVEMKRGVAGQPLLSNTHFVDATRTNFKNRQRMDLQGVLGRAFSASYAPKDGAPAEALKQGLTDLFNEHQTDGFVALHYEVSVYIARRPE
jgi:ubiquinone/menaquinone biosynthesis C-methylase UbiE